MSADKMGAALDRYVCSTALVCGALHFGGPGEVSATGGECG